MPVVGVVGHSDLTPGTLELAETTFRESLEPIVEQGITGVVRAGSGIPVVFARVLRQLGGRLMVMLPKGSARSAPLPDSQHPAVDELLLRADEVWDLPFDPADRDASVTADEQLVRSCDRLFAVWDGSPSGRRDATAHLVAYARSLGIAVEVMWPAGAERMGVSPLAK